VFCIEDPFVGIDLDDSLDVDGTSELKRCVIDLFDELARQQNGIIVELEFKHGNLCTRDFGGGS
jgi:hypothetical protein